MIAFEEIGFIPSVDYEEKIKFNLECDYEIISYSESQCVMVSKSAGFYEDIWKYNICIIQYSKNASYPNTKEIEFELSPAEMEAFRKI